MKKCDIKSIAQIFRRATHHRVKRVLDKEKPPLKRIGRLEGQNIGAN